MNLNFWNILSLSIGFAIGCFFAELTIKAFERWFYHRKHMQARAEIAALLDEYKHWHPAIIIERIKDKFGIE